MVPIGGDRDDWRAAFASANLAGCWAEGVDVADFRINWLKPKRVIKSAEQLEALTLAINAGVESRSPRG